jgi:cytoskeleton protein RodZ
MNEVIKATDAPEPLENSPNPASIDLTVGEKLALARAQQNWSIAQVARQLKWSARQIAEIEAGNYAVFPDVLTVRGFVRTYAKFLKMDSGLLLQELAEELSKLPSNATDRLTLDTPFPTIRMSWLDRQRDRLPQIWGALLLALLCLMMIFVWRAELGKWMYQFFPISVKNWIERSEHTLVAQQQIADQADSPRPNDKNLPLPSNQATERQPTSSALAFSPAASDVELDDNQQIGKLSLDDALILNFNQDSWVQIKRLDGSKVTERIYHAGDEETVHVSEPLNIVIGNAPGVEAKLRGQNLILTTKNNSNVANLDIE